jgi:hypothetical protein
MLEPVFARKARKSALAHVQLVVSRIQIAPDFSGGECRLGARVERSFRGVEVLPPGSLIELTVCCYVPPNRSPTGPRWLDFERLTVGCFLEAFLNRTADENGFEVAMWQIDFVEAPTDMPRADLWEVAGVPAKTGLLASLLRRFGR